MKLINTEIIEENDLQYKVETYDNGAVVKTIYVDPSTLPEPEPIPEPEYEPTENDLIMMALAENYEAVSTANSNSEIMMSAIADLYEVLS